MPEALMRLGELQWEIEREAFVDALQGLGQDAPSTSAAPRPSSTIAPSRDLFGRVLKDYPWFERVRPRALRRRLPRDRAGQGGRGARALRAHPARATRSSRFVPDAHMVKAEASSTSKYDYPARSPSTRRSSSSSADRPDLYGLALFKSAWCNWRLGNTDEAAKRFVSVFEVDRRAAAQGRERRAAEAARRAPGARRSSTSSRSSPRTRRTPRRTLYAFLTKIGGDALRGQGRARARRAVLRPGALRARHRGLRAPPEARADEPRRRGVDPPDRGGYNAHRGLPAPQGDYERAHRAVHGRRPVVAHAGRPGERRGDDGSRSRRQLRAGRDSRSTRKAQKDKTSRAEFEGAVGALRRLPRRGSRASRTPTRSSSTWARSTSTTSSADVDAATHYMAAAQGHPQRQATPSRWRPCATTRSTTRSPRSSAARRELEARKGKTSAQETETDKKFAEALDLYAQLYPTDPQLPELFFRQGKLLLRLRSTTRR